MSFEWSWRLVGPIADLLEHQKRQMKNQAGSLFGAELPIGRRDEVGLRTPQFQLIWMHVGSPELMRLNRTGKSRSDAAKHLLADGCATSPIHGLRRQSALRGRGSPESGGPSRLRARRCECHRATLGQDGAGRCE